MIKMIMKRSTILSAAVLGLMSFFLMVPNSGLAFDTINFDDQELTIYGWLRNNTGYFFEDQPLQQNDDRLATMRTWLRSYVDWKPSEHFKTWMAVQFAYEPEYDVEEGSNSEPDGKEYSEYDNINDVLREAYIEWIPNKSTDIKVGRQIVIWGESLTDRVGDVIHPEDSRFTLAFANLEDTRIPQWMIYAIHDFDFMSSSFEWIVNPLLTEDEYRVHRQPEYANGWTGTPGQRFGIHPEDRPLRTAGSLPGEVSTGFEPVYPDPWDDMRYGFRTSSYSGATNFGLMYWHTQSYDPIIERGDLTGNIVWFQPEREYSLIYPTMDIFGAYMNKQLSWPGVVRGEVVYSPNKSFNTFDVNDADAIVERSYFKYMIAYDLNNFFYFDWHKTAPFDITIEHVGEYIPDADDLQYIIYATERETFVPRFNGRITTNWLYDRLQTDIVVSYWPWAGSGLFMPSVKWKPGWWNQKFSAELKYIDVFGDNDYEGLGFLRTKDMIVLTTQFEF